MKRFIFIGLVLAFAAALYAAIGAANLSADARRGRAWYFTNDHTQAFTVWEAQLVAKLEADGLEYNKQRLSASAARKAQISSLSETFRGASNEQMTAIVAYVQSLGLSVEALNRTKLP